MNFVHIVWTIVRKDWAIERRTRQSLAVMLVFALSATITFVFAQGDFNLNAARDNALGLLWTVIFLSGTLGLNRTFSAETETQALSATLIAPITPAALYIGKLCSVLIVQLITLLVLLPLFVVFFDRPIYHPAILLILLLGTIGYAAAGTLVASMAAQTRSVGVLIPVLVLPLTLPVIYTAATGSALFLAPQPPDFNNSWPPIALVLTYDLLMLIVGVMTYNYVVEE